MASASSESFGPGRDPEPLVRCPSCDLLQRGPALPAGTAAHCPRCGHLLYRERAPGLDRTLALTLTAAVLLLVANAMPFMTFEFQGRQQSNFILSGVLQLWHEGFELVAAVVLFTTLVAPAIYLGGMLYVLIPLYLGHRPPGLGPVFGRLLELRPWAMLEVYLLGVLVAVVKLGQLATITPDTAMFAFAGLILVWTAATASLDPRVVWDACGIATLGPATPAGDAARSHHCRVCGLLALPPGRDPPAGSSLHCPRCGARLERRKPQSLSRCWALVVAAAILYVPANLYPILTVEILGQSETDTIYAGVVSLVAAGMWEIGALVFFASILVPLLKLVGLTLLLIWVRRRSQWQARTRTEFYRLIETVGRWSFIDTFMISILVALVQLGAVATIYAGVGATCFAAVIVITMFAAASFDPRIVWDVEEGQA